MARLSNRAIHHVILLLLVRVRREQETGLELFVNRRLDGSIPLASSMNSADESTSLRLTELLLSSINSATVTAIVTVCFSK